MVRIARLKAYSALVLVAALGGQVLVGCSDDPKPSIPDSGADGSGTGTGTGTGTTGTTGGADADADADSGTTPDGSPDADASPDGDATAPTATQLVSLSVKPSTSKAAKGTVITLAVKGKYNDGKEIDITRFAGLDLTLSVAAPVADATSDYGIFAVRALAAGKVTLTVTDRESKISGSADVEITDAKLKSLAITAAKAKLAKGLFQDLKATATFDDESTQDVTLQTAWSASPEGAVSFEQAIGGRNRLRTLEEGKVTVTGRYEEQAATTEFEVSGATPVSIAFADAPKSISLRTTQRLKVNAKLTDDTTVDVSGNVTYASSDASVLLVEPSGIVTAAALGKAIITVTTPAGPQAQAEIEVTEPVLESIYLEADDATGDPLGTLKELDARQLKLVGRFSDRSLQNLSAKAEWSSENPDILTVDNGAHKGLITAIKPGDATLVVTIDAKAVSKSTSIVDIRQYRQPIKVVAR
mgnify:CR=1 FL=1